MSGASSGGDFLARMAAGSRRRVDEARRNETFEAVRDRALAAAPVRRLVLDRFDVIAEVKRVSPAAGRLAAARGTDVADAVAQALAYEAGGACAISVLTEPDAFDGSLQDLAAVSAAVRIPVMRKDFIIDPWQVWEARAAGASGVLLVLRLVDDTLLDALLVACRATGTFAVLEAFDAEDLRRAAAIVARYPTDRARSATVLAGVNTRDLQTLAVDEHRTAALAPQLPPAPGVAESGIASPADAARARRFGYGLALVGTYLMRHDTPREALAALLRAGREVA